MKGAVFLSDEGFGHIVRQSAIADKLQQLNTDTNLDVYTHAHIDMARKIFSNANLIDRYNNISWHKRSDGSPDLQKIEDHYADYSNRSDQYVEQFGEIKADFIITDFVYEAFSIAKKSKIPSFGVAHFTWDWFFSKLYPPVISTALIRSFIKQAEQADKLYFPPFTPEEILNHFGNKVVQVPLIVRKKLVREQQQDERFKVLIIDSGAGVLSQSIKKASNQFSEIDDVLFFTMNSNVVSTNVHIIPQGELLADYISRVDLVIGRAGFNTISECIAYRTPMLLLGESANPEMSENIVNLKKSGLGSFMSLKDFESNLAKFLSGFIKNEYSQLQSNMNDHSFEINGAEVIAEDILNSL